MERRISEQPDRWVIVKLTEEDAYKVYATWAGGYTSGDRWQMNSGITEVDQDDEYYYFVGMSGSCYKCHKKGYGVMTSYGQGVLDHILKMAEGKMELEEDREDWSEIIEA